MDDKNMSSVRKCSIGERKTKIFSKKKNRKFRMEIDHIWTYYRLEKRIKYFAIILDEHRLKNTRRLSTSSIKLTASPLISQKMNYL